MLINWGEGGGVADRLVVDGTELDRFFKDLRKARDSFTALQRALHDSGVDGLGTDDLDKACDEFQKDWHYGAKEIAGQIEELTDLTKKAKDDFHEVDVALEKALEKVRHKGGKK
ncbi:hypothetical protein [Streptomyces pseudovenezuelae]|uniref:PE domain-containing protein n=1 Tax=Streptomyces pseudovenezuelae TaxID=67350 RepID=A0ABT6LV76_9ACTN|nr:hypothetical protein [Streptomyces pseudovenezuelae]MDH6220215.1 hypothetical protein [Streptomyces pseudovenezuelae]